MKKITFFISFIFLASVVFAQMPQINQNYKTLSNERIQKPIVKKHQESKDNSRWFNYGESVDGFLNLDETYSANNLFPDSSIKVLYTGGVVGGPWIHAISDWFDVKSIYWENPSEPGAMYLSTSSTFTLDSIEICGWYSRTLGAGVIDTLVVEVAVNPDMTTLGSYYFAGTTAANFGTDTVSFIGMPYNQPANNLDLPGKVVYKIPLTQAIANDTAADGLNYIDISTASLPLVNVPFFAVTFKFIPGYSYSWSDTLSEKNFFKFLSMEENDAGFMTSYQKNDYNMSFILPQDVRYNAASSWNDNYVPTVAYTIDYSYEHHLTYYKLTGVSGVNFVSIDENTANNTIVCYPNPVNNSMSVVLTDVNNATISIIDLMGNKVIELIPSENTTTLNLSDLSSGIYMVQVIQNGKVSTQKLVKE